MSKSGPNMSEDAANEDQPKKENSQPREEKKEQDQDQDQEKASPIHQAIDKILKELSKHKRELLQILFPWLTVLHLLNFDRELTRIEAYRHHLDLLAEVCVDPKTAKRLKIPTERYCASSQTLQPVEVDEEGNEVKRCKEEQVRLLVHIEFQLQNQRTIIPRLLMYFGGICMAYGIPPVQIVVFLGTKRDMPSRLEFEALGASLYYQYLLVDLSDIEARRFLESDIPELKLLAVLGKPGDLEREEVLKQVLDAILAVKDEHKST